MVTFTIKNKLLVFFLFLPFLVNAANLLEKIKITESPYCYFSPPSGWNCADPSILSEFVLVGFVGKGSTAFRPSINLAVEEVNISFKEYLKIVKDIHEADRKTTWRDLGKIKTKAGDAELTEISTTTKWGDTKMLQLILVKEGKAYILAGAVLKDEFPTFYKDFLSSFRSLTLVPDLISSIENIEKKESLKNALEKIKTCQNNEIAKTWKSFQTLILNDYKDMGEYWQILIMKDTYNLCRKD